MLTHDEWFKKPLSERYISKQGKLKWHRFIMMPWVDDDIIAVVQLMYLDECNNVKFRTVASNAICKSQQDCIDYFEFISNILLDKLKSKEFDNMDLCQIHRYMINNGYCKYAKCDN